MCSYEQERLPRVKTIHAKGVDSATIEDKEKYLFKPTFKPLWQKQVAQHAVSHALVLVFYASFATNAHVSDVWSCMGPSLQSLHAQATNLARSTSSGIYQACCHMVGAECPSDALRLRSQLAC